MGKIRTCENSMFLGDWTNWDYNSNYNYHTGVSYTRKGLIVLYHQAEISGEHKPYASARIIYKGRVFDLETDDEVTRIGWIRIAKKWAKAIWKGL